MNRVEEDRVGVGGWEDGNWCVGTVWFQIPNFADFNLIMFTQPNVFAIFRKKIVPFDM